LKSDIADSQCGRREAIPWQGGQNATLIQRWMPFSSHSGSRGHRAGKRGLTGSLGAIPGALLDALPATHFLVHLDERKMAAIRF